MKDKNDILTLLLSVLVVCNMWRNHSISVLDIIILIIIAANIILIIGKRCRK